MRGTFANVRLRNQLAPGTEGGVTLHLPDGEQTTIYDAAERYAAEGVPLVVLAGKEYGSGSSRDWAAKGTALLGVRAVLAESYERIHRSNLIGMGVLPLQYAEGQNAASLGLTGHEVFTITGLEPLNDGVTPKTVTVRAEDGDRVVEFEARSAHRHPDGGRVLPPRRDPPVHAPPDGRIAPGAVRSDCRLPDRHRPSRFGGWTQPARGSTNQAITTKCRTAPTMVQAWKTSWYPNTPGAGSGFFSA